MLQVLYRKYSVVVYWYWFQNFDNIIYKIIFVYSYNINDKFLYNTFIYIIHELMLQKHWKILDIR